MEDNDPRNAIYLYMGILDAYEAIAEELMGKNAVADQIIPRMIYYVRNFLPAAMEGKSDGQIVNDLGTFLEEMRSKVYDEKKIGSITMDNVWEVRAAIFGFENVFLEVLGEEVIQNYVFQRVADILTIYLPSVFKDSELSLEQKLDQFATYLEDQKFVRTSSFSIKGDKIEFRANYCAFAAIHGSNAYRDGKVRFCPWGMISNSIVAAHFQETTGIEDCAFTTKGSITTLPMVN